MARSRAMSQSPSQSPPESQPPQSEAPVRPGDILAGKYRIDRVLGAGGMGVVVAATHLELDQRVAVKFLLATALNNPEASARFVREARAAVKIKSEHVARVIDVSRLDNGAPYIVMEYLEGQDLSSLLGAGPLAIEDAVDYIVQACDAMAEAHAAGIVHRDLKPSNLFLTRRSDGGGLVKVLDFGISKVSMPDTSEAHLTKTSTIIGSPFYMSPEQLKSAREVDHRTDVWSLGVILYELLSGRPPFYAETLPELIAAIMVTDVPSIRALRPDVPPELEAVILHALEKNRDLRFKNVGELAAALVPFAPRRSRFTLERVLKISGAEAPPQSVAPAPPTVRHVSGVETVAASTAAGATWSGTQPVELPKKASPWPWIALGGVIVGGLGVAAIFALRSAPAETPAASTAEVPRAATVSEPEPAATQAAPVATPSVSPAAEAPSATPAAEAPSVTPAPSVTSAPPVATAAPVTRVAPKTGTASKTARTEPVAAAEPKATAAVTAAPAPSATARRRTLNIDLK